MSVQTLSRALATFLLAKEAENLSPRTIKWYEDQVTVFVRFMDDKPAAAVTATDIQEYLVAERNRGLSSSTVSARYRSLQALFNFLEDHPDYGFPSPLGHGRNKAVRKPKTSHDPIAYVHYDEFMAIVESIPSGPEATWLDRRDRCLLIILFWSGLRLGELAALNVHDVDMRNGLITVRNGKGAKGRIVPAADELSVHLIDYLVNRPHWAGPELWLSADKDGVTVKGPLQPEGIRQILKRRCRRAGVRYIHPHAWRHGFAMAMLNHGADMSSIANMLGHSSEKVTEAIYAHWLTDGLKREYREVAARIRSSGKGKNSQR